MTVLVLERASSRCRGKVSRWMLEVSPGVFVGQLAAGVRELLWWSLEPDAGATMLWPAPGEQGLGFRQQPGARYRLADYDGLVLSHSSSSTP